MTMYGIKDPVIIERSWRAVREITAEQLSRDIAYAEDISFHVHEVHFEDRASRPVVVVWVAGRRAGNLLSEYCITERPKVLSEDPARDSQICGYEITVGRMASEYCGERMAPGLYFCRSHHDDVMAEYGEVRMAPGNVPGR